MRIIDISVPIYTGMASYPGDPGAVINSAQSIAQGNAANLSQLSLGSHTGTHLDAPHHFEKGGITVDRVPLETLVGPARVIDLTDAGSQISANNLEAAGAAGAERLLLKTSNSRLWAQPDFTPGYVSLSDDAANFLVEKELKLVGIDYLSIERFKSPDHYVHHTLLAAGVLILEGADLSGVEAGEYEIVSLPLKIAGGDGAPARTILIKR